MEAGAHLRRSGHLDRAGRAPSGRQRQGGDAYRTDPLDDQWELYDLTADAIEANNRWTDPGLHDLRRHLRTELKQARTSAVPERHNPWPYADRQPPVDEPGFVRRVLGRFGL
jgi:hypothetical protein